MKLKAWEIAECTGGSVVSGSADTVFSGVSTDSRTVGKGDLFVALGGEHFDGHVFVAEAIAKGAAGAVIMKEGLRGKGTIISVEDTLAALGDIGGYVRNQYNPVVVGITGSTGKTTVKELCASILAQDGPCLKTQKNYNNLIGVPLCLLELTEEHRYAVIEMGTNRFGEIDRLSSIVRPKVSILSNINPVHLSGLRSISGIIKEKQAIFRNTVSDGIAVINPHLENMDRVEIPRSLKIITYSSSEGADVTLKEVLHQGLDGTEVLMDLGGEPLHTHVPLPGMHNVCNAMAAAACAMGLGIGLDKISKGIQEAKFPGMRSEIIVSDHISIINDSYNANPASMKAALQMLVSSPHSYRVAVLGDMLELGTEAEHWHTQLGQWVAQAGIDRLVVTGEMSKIISEGAVGQGMNPSAVHIAEGLPQIIENLSDVLDKDAIVLVKASRALHLDEVVTHLKAVA
ncbi:MAG TPA: UDP-N-acetylmuramoyl-tripeptide--D-alanyl-D-alanine ligase [Deltaproteobacteria bacterium]|jgi:UDP-N-acetylmuramoyl-tripeptide--D-alanyl-D-alanine ligase|nr:UDP-N-acetylmuramoyl-tripeptide--D-alanyl-D-alanine ligase [Deltaproteobacteria bacterium]HOI07199.1 UDP-N-acetylmuramoyl-tripeptide--D-alanyl-D-alanine ligase [Deltaproteobacteria bacterium]